MKQISITLILVLSILTVSTATQQTKSQQWEYKFVYQCDEKKANSAAQDGWELSDMSMGVYGSQGVATCVFRRSRPQ